jgi:glycosyltransferase involved in cell wall biosynthesis
MRTDDLRHEDGPPGLLRALVFFHEAEELGAGTSVLRVVDELATYGWTASGWIPGDGPLQRSASEHLAVTLSAERSHAFSRRGWREAPGTRIRAARTPAYVKAVRAALARVRPHVVHANTLLSLPEAAVARSCGLPVVLQVHELPPPGAKTRAAVYFAARVADVLVGVSDAVSAMLRRHAGTTPVLTVRNGVPELDLATRESERPFTVGMVGTVSRVKGTDTFLRAAQLALRQRPGMRFEHVGSPDLHRAPGLDAEIAALLADFGAADSVAMLGARPAESVLSRWDVFLLTSRSEGFPLATLEAMSAGLPVVATAVGGVPEQMTHLVSGILVPPDDPEAIASWLVKLHDEPELRHRVGSDGARCVRTEFTIARQAEGLHRAYLSALNLRFAPRPIRQRIAATA